MRIFLLIQALPFVWFGCAHGSRCRIDTLIEHYTKLQESRVLIWRLVLVFMFTESFVDQRRECMAEAAYSIGIGRLVVCSNIMTFELGKDLNDNDSKQET